MHRRRDTRLANLHTTPTLDRKSATEALHNKLKSVIEEAAENMSEEQFIRAARKANRIVDEARARASRRGRA